MKKICIYGGKGVVYPFLGLLCMGFQNLHAKWGCEKMQTLFSQPHLPSILNSFMQEPEAVCDNQSKESSDRLTSRPL